MSDVARLFRHRRLHHVIEGQVLPHLRAKAWDEAVNDAFIGLETRLREVTGSDNGYGTGLIDLALKPGSGVLVDSAVPKAEQEGIHQLALGVYRTYRNRGAHHFVGPSPDEAVDVVLLVDRMIRWIDRSDLKRQRRPVPYTDIPAPRPWTAEPGEFRCDVDQDGHEEVLRGDPNPDVAVRVFRDGADGRIPITVRQPWRPSGLSLVNAFVRFPPEPHFSHRCELLTPTGLLITRS